MSNNRYKLFRNAEAQAAINRQHAAKEKNADLLLDKLRFFQSDANIPKSRDEYLKILVTNIYEFDKENKLNEGIGNLVNTALDKLFNTTQISDVKKFLRSDDEAELFDESKINHVVKEDLVKFIHAAINRGVISASDPNLASYSEWLTAMAGEGFKFNQGEARTYVLEAKVSAGDQCARAMKFLPDIIHKTCWICQLPINKGTSPPECEHMFPLLDALRYSTLVREGAREFKELSEPYQRLNELEYRWSHRCCNQIKNDIGLVARLDSTNRYSLHEENATKLLHTIADRMQGISIDKKGNRTTTGLYDCQAIVNGEDIPAITSSLKSPGFLDSMRELLGSIFDCMNTRSDIIDKVLPGVSTEKKVRINDSLNVLSVFANLMSDKAYALFGAMINFYNFQREPDAVKTGTIDKVKAGKRPRSNSNGSNEEPKKKRTSGGAFEFSDINIPVYKLKLFSQNEVVEFTKDSSHLFLIAACTAKLSDYDIDNTLIPNNDPHDRYDILIKMNEIFNRLIIDDETKPIKIYDESHETSQEKTRNANKLWENAIKYKYNYYRNMMREIPILGYRPGYKTSRDNILRRGALIDFADMASNTINVMYDNNNLFTHEDKQDRIKTINKTFEKIFNKYTDPITKSYMDEKLNHIYDRIIDETNRYFNQIQQYRQHVTRNERDAKKQLLQTPTQPPISDSTLNSSLESASAELHDVWSSLDMYSRHYNKRTAVEHRKKYVKSMQEKQKEEAAEQQRQAIEKQHQAIEKQKEEAAEQQRQAIEKQRQAIEKQKEEAAEQQRQAIEKQKEEAAKQQQQQEELRREEEELRRESIRERHKLNNAYRSRVSAVKQLAIEDPTFRQKLIKYVKENPGIQKGTFAAALYSPEIQEKIQEDIEQEQERVQREYNMQQSKRAQNPQSRYHPMPTTFELEDEKEDALPAATPQQSRGLLSSMMSKVGSFFSSTPAASNGIAKTEARTATVATPSQSRGFFDSLTSRVSSSVSGVSSLISRSKKQIEQQIQDIQTTAVQMATEESTEARLEESTASTAANEAAAAAQKAAAAAQKAAAEAERTAEVARRNQSNRSEAARAAAARAIAEAAEAAEAARLAKEGAEWAAGVQRERQKRYKEARDERVAAEQRAAAAEAAAQQFFSFQTQQAAQQQLEAQLAAARAETQRRAEAAAAAAAEAAADAEAAAKRAAAAEQRKQTLAQRQKSTRNISIQKAADDAARIAKAEAAAAAESQKRKDAVAARYAARDAAAQKAAAEEAARVEAVRAAKEAEAFSHKTVIRPVSHGPHNIELGTELGNEQGLVTGQPGTGSTWELWFNRNAQGRAIGSNVPPLSKREQQALSRLHREGARSAAETEAAIRTSDLAKIFLNEVPLTTPNNQIKIRARQLPADVQIVVSQELKKGDWRAARALQQGSQGGKRKTKRAQHKKRKGWLSRRNYHIGGVLRNTRRGHVRKGLNVTRIGRKKSIR